MEKACEVRKLSACEWMIMKLICDADGDIPVQELIVRMRECYGKDYARTTMVTFLKKMSDKGYVSTYRVGRISFAHAERDVREYKRQILKEEIDFWFDGRPSELISVLYSGQKLPREERENIRKLLDEMAV